MRAHVLQHASFEGPGTIQQWLDQHGADTRVTRLFAGDSCPSVDDIDALIAMGGPMSVNDEQEFEWLRSEKALVRAAIERGIPVLGVCLGAQLIANAAGARVYKNAAREIGWFPIRGIPHSEAEGSRFRFPTVCPAFHWHGETFDLPRGAERLASSAACENQAFQLGEHVIGLQFHLEVTPTSVSALIDHCADDIVDGPYVQTAAAMRSAPESQHDAANRLMEEVLTWLMQSRA